ncbi:NAD+ synthase [Burkholderiaceae bacterium FT117]|uniref:NAD+ synthase n=1 Tax=Zeimonas sediminis TaxID=2944268 RepID=UPI002342EDB5|nr:NAD+ synthase [Zeimonas sediminis]MCM5569367.1 NAD+ synthase [Zeimonas sediminis]
MRIAAAQLNQTVGDFRGNADRIIEAAREAAALGVRVLLTPELSLTGYPPEDLLLRDAFQRRSDEALARIREATADLDLYLLVGHPLVEGEGAARRRFNAASLLHAGRIAGICHKRELPNYAVFDEARYFARGDTPFVFDVDGIRLGVAICEDFWFPTAPKALRDAGAQAVLVLNASPYHLGKQHQRLDTARANVCALGLPMLAANLAGGQDELVFDGLSFALSAAGELAAQGRAFEPDLLVVELAAEGGRADIARQAVAELPQLEAQVYGALVLGVRDYIGKNGFPGAIIGLSGGVDSALVLAIAVDALGADKVRAVMMPSPYTAEISWIDARDMAHRLGVRYDELPIGACFDAFRATLAQEFHGLPEDTTEENLQARIRGTLLMALSNKYGSIVLTTGNKSEMAVGYATLYGDMAGGFAVIKDIAKTLVWRLCRWRNTVSDVIPERIITRPPSAELKPGQTDQDSLPPYETLDAIVRMYMEEDRSVDEIVAAGHPADAVARVVRLIQVNEYKRRQAPVGIRVTHRAFGRDWRYPITSKFRD